MLCLSLGSAKAQTYPVGKSSASDHQNGPTEVSLQEARSHWKIFKMAHLTGRVLFKVGGQEYYQGKGDC
jgi:hypothetical protein